jgi:hypothetical protein
MMHVPAENPDMHAAVFTPMQDVGGAEGGKKPPRDKMLYRKKY